MEERKSIKFIYNKTSNYKTYMVEGVVGGLTPKGKIFIDFFNEKIPIPNFVEHEIIDGELGKEIQRDTTKGIIREIDCGIYLDVPTAIVFSNWLQDRIKEYEKKTKLKKK